jgi:hypothetical protein
MVPLRQIQRLANWFIYNLDVTGVDGIMNGIGSTRIRTEFGLKSTKPWIGFIPKAIGQRE